MDSFDYFRRNGNLANNISENEQNYPDRIQI